MPKLQNVTESALTELLENQSFEISQIAKDFADRMEKGYCDDLGNSMDLARAALSVSRSFSDLAAQLLSHAAFAELKRETERLIRERAKS